MNRDTTFHRGLRVVLLMAALTMAYGAAEAQIVVSFPDTLLESAVRAAIDKPGGSILDTDLVGVGFTRLDAYGSDEPGSDAITDLTGLEYKARAKL